MTVAIVGTFTGGYAPPGGFSYVGSASGPAQVTVGNVPGDWMIAVTAWQQPAPGFGTSMAAADDVHNWWEPVAPDSPASGLVRCSVWAAPAARGAAFFQACPTMAVTSVATAVYDVSGIGPGWLPQPVGFNDASSGTSITTPGGTAVAQSMVITAFASAQAVSTITPPAGWTPIGGSTIVSGASPSESITVAVAYQVIAAGAAIPSATWSLSGGAVALAGVTVAIPLAATVPAQPSPDWPAVITEAAIGSGPQSPPSSLTWLDMSARSLALQVQQGRQYSLSQLQAAQGTVTLDNPDGALIPPGGGWQLQVHGDGVTANPFAGAQKVPVTAGASYPVAAWMESPQGGIGGVISIDWYNGVTYLSTSSIGGGTLAAGVTALVSGAVTAAATATLAQFDVKITGTPAASAILNAAAAALPGGLNPPAGTAWTPNNNATVTVLGPWTPSYPGIDSGTPVRRRCYWPGGAWQVSVSGDGVTANPFATSVKVPVSARASYPVSFWAMSPQGYAGGAQLSVDWYTGGGGFISTSTLGGALAANVPVLITGTVTAPATAAQAQLDVKLGGTPPSSVTLLAAAAPLQAGQLTPPAGTTWSANNGATVTNLAPWAPDPRGAPVPTPWGIPFSGYFRRWPFTAPDVLRGLTVAEVSDIWAYATGSLNSMAREEMLLDGPYALWPLDDATGAVAASNIAPGNSNPLQLITAKLGAGGATQAWGQNSGALAGDGSTLVTQSGKSGGGSGDYQLTLAGTSLNTNGYGYSLTCTDPGFPQLAGGVTVETWFSCTANTNTTGFGFSNSGNTLTVPNSSFANGTPVVFSSAGPALPTGMTAGTIYFVIAQSGATFQISTTVGGSAVTLSSNSVGFVATTTVFNPVILALRNAAGSVFSVQVRNTDGSLFVSGKTVATTTIDTSRDWRQTGTLFHLSIALTATTWRVMLDGGGVSTSSGSLTSAPAWSALCAGGVMDRLSQGFALPGQLALAAVYPYAVPPNRVEAHFFAGLGLPGDHAETRVDRILSYAGLAGRRWIGQQNGTYELDTTPSGRDIGGQSPATSAGNVAASTVPAVLAVAPTGDVTYIAKQYSWNKGVRWTLGDATAAGEIPFSLAQFSTDYDPTRVYNGVQLTQLDTQSVTVPSGATATTTVAAMTAASGQQYGGQPYQQTAYLINDYLAAYMAGSGLVDLAAWIAMIYGRPRNRVPGVVVDAAAYPSAWPLFLRAAVGDMVQVNVRLPTAATSPVVSVIARVTQTQRAMKWDTQGAPVATIALTLDAAPEFSALTCDDAVRGLLNGVNVLAWLWRPRDGPNLPAPRCRPASSRTRPWPRSSGRTAQSGCRTPATGPGSPGTSHTACSPRPGCP